MRCEPVLLVRNKFKYHNHEHCVDDCALYFQYIFVVMYTCLTVVQAGYFSNFTIARK